MDNQQTEQAAKKRTLIFAAIAVSAVTLVAAIAFVILSKVKNQQENSVGVSQEQFQAAPELSAALQSECQESAAKLATLKSNDELEAEFKSHVTNCREVYFSIEAESAFRKEGMYADLAVDLSHYFSKENKAKAMAMMNFAKSLKPWEFYLGPVSCDSHHVLDAYIESLNLPSEKTCISMAQYKEKLIPDLQKKNFNVLKSVLSNVDVVWMGQPESDVGCPEKISSVIDLLNKLLPTTVTVEDPKTEESDPQELSLALKNNGEEKVVLVFRAENQCLQIRSLLVPNLEVVE